MLGEFGALFRERSWAPITKPLAALIASLLIGGCAAQLSNQRVRSQRLYLNSYVVQAVQHLAQDYQGLGYGSQAFTHDLRFGDSGTLAATGKPLTMCVAAQLEVFVEALNLYADETQDFQAFHFIPKTSWERLRPGDLRGQIWVVADATSHGISDALQNYGMGEKKPFARLKPGDFVNFNRDNGSGHGVVFLGYLDRTGNELATYGPEVAGFKYFSSQGHLVGGGLGYRYAFFKPYCPVLADARKRDCGVIRSESQRLLNTGSAWLPSTWDRETADAFRRSVTSRSFVEGEFDANYFTGVTTDD